MVPGTHRQGSSARLGWGGQRKPLALGTGNTVLDLMCVLFVVVLLNDFMVTTTQPYGDRGHCGSPTASSRGGVRTPEQMSACRQMAPSSGGLAGPVWDMLGPHLGHGPCQEPAARAVPGPGQVSLLHIVTTGSGSGLKGSESLG